MSERTGKETILRQEGIALTWCKVPGSVYYVQLCGHCLPCLYALSVCLVYGIIFCVASITYFASGLVPGPSLGPGLCPECAGIGPKWAKQVPRVPGA